MPESDYVRERPKVEDSLSYEERMHNKDEHEAFLWSRITTKVPWNIKKSTDEEDKRGIDAWAVSLKNGFRIRPKSIQLKMRHSGGDDVLIEMVRPWPPKDAKNIWTGRDIKTKVDYYYSVSTQGLLRIFNARTLKELAIQMCSQFIGRFNLNPYIKTMSFREGEVKIITDPSEESTFGMGKVKKLAAFINPLVLKPTYIVQL